MRCPVVVDFSGVDVSDNDDVDMDLFFSHFLEAF